MGRTETRRQKSIDEEMFFFQDPEFPPDVAMRGVIDYHKNTQISWDDYHWVPASCLNPNCYSNGNPSPNDSWREHTLFPRIHPMDLNQGSLGNCWLVSALSCLAKYPQWVGSLFEEVTFDGKYVVLLYDLVGKPFRVTIDEFIPVRKRVIPGRPGRPGRQDRKFSFKPFFISDSGGLWPLLLEKAVAKLVGFYAIMGEGSLPSFAFHTLHGITSATWRRDQGLWTKCLCSSWGQFGVCGQQRTNERLRARSFEAYFWECYENERMICAGISARSDLADQARWWGLVTDHAYAMIDARVVRSHSNILLVKLRNPHGCGRWKGEWSDECSLWLEFPAVADALGFRPVTESRSYIASGTFWMPSDQFIRFFDWVEICDDPMHDRPADRRIGGRLRSLSPAQMQQRERARSATPGRPAPPVIKKKKKAQGTRRKGEEGQDLRHPDLRYMAGRHLHARSTKMKAEDVRHREDHHLSDGFRCPPMRIGDACPTMRKQLDGAGDFCPTPSDVILWELLLLESCLIAHLAASIEQKIND